LLSDDGRLVITGIPAKYDKDYKGRAREGDAVYSVNVARLSCTCPEFQSQRASFPADDARRVCEHLYDKLCSTKVERALDLLTQLFIRYGRRMLAYEVVQDDFGVLAIGQPFGPDTVRAIGDMNGKPLLATYDLRDADWQSGETPLTPSQQQAVLARMRRAFPTVEFPGFINSG
jgi:hypothetical protein